MEVLHQIWSVAFAIGIVGNLVASALWAIPALIHLHRKIDRHHRELVGERISSSNPSYYDIGSPNSSDAWTTNENDNKVDTGRNEGGGAS